MHEDLIKAERLVKEASCKLERIQKIAVDDAMSVSERLTEIEKEINNET